ncbi:hypothetical protein PISMIDRAFT_96162 [Pisolithus microcarpus 441]|uniref:Integrase catalytic domain-containing protein n=1 Tax=Pisolithus microcarpus 441 TaxID=765257 RepID=A0A0D0A108_9AGAM|nr:hypothetical protein PISMIDRAFT_96162 [Pisolithus microcarpus 441]
MAREEHTRNGHWGRDLTKLKLMDKVYSPRLDQSIVTALLQCPQCKNFGSTHLHALMYPITRRHPFELVVADYLALPKGKGGFHNVLLILDTFSQFVWGFKLKVHGTAKTTIDGLKAVAHTFRTPETFMTDGGSHFNNGELLGRLRRLCSPGLGEDEGEDTGTAEVGKAWPDHFDAAVRQLNERIVPAFGFSPKELLLGFVVNTTRTPVEAITTEPSAEEVDVQLAYVEQQRLDGTDLAALHAVKRKATFDWKVLRTHPGEVVFQGGQLVQVYDNALDNTLTTARKLRPRWSAPRRVTDQVGNSYRVQTLEGFPINSLIHARRLRRFVPREGTALAEVQQEQEEGLEETRQEEANEDEEQAEQSEGEETVEEEGDE